MQAAVVLMEFCKLYASSQIIYDICMLCEEGGNSSFPVNDSVQSQPFYIVRI